VALGFACNTASCPGSRLSPGGSCRVCLRVAARTDHRVARWRREGGFRAALYVRRNRESCGRQELMRNHICTNAERVAVNSSFLKRSPALHPTVA